jgi:hypothetical protein
LRPFTAGIEDGAPAGAALATVAGTTTLSAMPAAAAPHVRRKYLRMKVIAVAAPGIYVPACAVNGR